MSRENYRKGQYAEIMTEYAEHIYRGNTSKTERNYRYTAPEGTTREVDVCTTLTTGEQIAFEVRDRQHTQSIDWVDQVIGKYQGSPFVQIWICTFDGCKLSENAIKKLNYHKIGWRDFNLINLPTSIDEQPIIMVDAITYDPNKIKIYVDGIVYEDLQVGMRNGQTTTHKEAIIPKLREIISTNFQQLQRIDLLRLEGKISLSGIENNFGKQSISVCTEIPLRHVVFVDYFNESYSVVNNGMTSNMLSSIEKSVFATSEAIVINLSYFTKLEKNAIISNSFMLKIENLPQKYKCHNTLKLIDTEGGSTMVITKIYGSNNRRADT